MAGNEQAGNATLLSRAKLLRDAAGKLRESIYILEPSQVPPQSEGIVKEDAVGIDVIALHLDCALSSVLDAQQFLDEEVKPRIGV